MSLRRCRAMPLTTETDRLHQRVGHSGVHYDDSVYVFVSQGQAAFGAPS
jgi:hypothetical protein